MLGTIRSIGIDEKEAVQVTQNQSWKCPKCIEEDLLKRRKLSKSAPVKAIKKFVKKVIPSGKKSTPTKSRPKKVLNYKDDSSSSDTDEKSKKKIIGTTKPVKSKKIVEDSESSSDSSESESSDDESDVDSGKIIRIPVDKYEYY